MSSGPDIAPSAPLYLVGPCVLYRAPCLRFSHSQVENRWYW